MTLKIKLRWALVVVKNAGNSENLMYGTDVEVRQTQLEG